MPGDKSISHRALMLGACALGETRISGLLEGEDVLATATALEAMGATIDRQGAGEWRVHGVGTGGLLQPATALDLGNSGTSARLLMGLIASHAITATLTGDASLSRRPMGRVIEPLSLMGADFDASPGARLPLTMRGLVPAVPITWRATVASAQVKSAVLLAGLNTAGTTRVIEPVPTRDHTERMLAAFGAQVTIGEDDGARVVSLAGEADLKAQPIEVPGDPSSAAFFIVAALLVPGSDLIIENVGMNPTRTGLITVLRQMGAYIEAQELRDVGGEPVADLRVRHSSLSGIDVDPLHVPAMIDEFPTLFVTACLASGRTVTRGLGELRVKESDRLATMAQALLLAGARLEEREDGLVIEGSSGDPLPGTPPGAVVASRLDHRICMAMAVAGLASRTGVQVGDMTPVATSFPGFTDLLEQAMR